MVKTSTDKKRTSYQVFEPDFSEYNSVYANDVVINDIDIALRNRQLRGIVDSMLVDMTPDAQPIQLTDEQYMDTFIGKDIEPDELNILAHKYADQYNKDLRESRNNRDRH